MASAGASCFHTLTTDTQDMTLQQFAVWWDDLSDPKVATSVSTLAEWKNDIEKLCTYEQDCTEAVQTAVDTFYAKVSAAHAAALKIVAKRTK